MLEETALRGPDRVALIAGDVTITYGELAEQVSRLAAGLVNLGLSAGDRVAVLLPNSIELATALLAANHAGLIAVPLFADYPPTEKREILESTAARVLITTPTLRPSVPPDALQPRTLVVLTGGEAPGCLTDIELMETGPLGTADRLFDQAHANGDPIGIIVHTSGSTGRPKGVAHTQSRLVNRADLLIETLSLTADDRTLTAQHLGRPLFLVADLLAMLRVGGCLTLVDPPTTDLFWHLYATTRPTYYLAPPGYSYRLMENPAAALADHSCLRFWINVGDRPSESLSRHLATLTGRPPLNMFGMTEAGFLSITASGHADRSSAPVKTSSIGKPMAGVELRLVDHTGREVDPGAVGRLRIRTPNMMVGYWNDTLLTHQTMGSGWLETQDLMRVDEDGDYLFMGRNSETIVRNGANVASARVIESLLAHPAIAEVILVGLPDRCDGQVPIAFYRLKAGTADPGAEALHAWVSTRVDAWSIPAGFYPLDQWPVTAQGKIDRQRLIEMAETRRPV
jgi:acyl-coenzyme A synthetase/AMP-(fatty) acid ligase